MECREAGKKIKEYAGDEIKDEFLRKELEEHISGCPACKRELFLWQEVLAKQEAIGKLKKKMPGEFSERVKLRSKQASSGINLPPMVRRLQSMNQFASSPKGCLLIQILIVMAGLLFVYLFINKGTNIFTIIFIVLGFLAMIFVLFKNSFKKKK